MSVPPYSRLAAVSLFAAIVAVPGVARADLPELIACAGKTDNAERLACYDAAVAKLKKQGYRRKPAPGDVVRLPAAIHRLRRGRQGQG